MRNTDHTEDSTPTEASGDFESFQLLVTDPDHVKILRPKLETEEKKNSTLRPLPDFIVLRWQVPQVSVTALKDGTPQTIAFDESTTEIEVTVPYPVRFYPSEDGVATILDGQAIQFLRPPTDTELIARRNAAHDIQIPSFSRPEQTVQALPTRLWQPTFLEARAVVHALSDARDGRHWEIVEGATALLHRPPRANHQVRFEPNALLTTWLDYSITPQKTQAQRTQVLWDELKKISFEGTVILNVALACILQSKMARWTSTLDDFIKLIGRDTDARRSEEDRKRLRREVWEYLLYFGSMPVIGARPGIWMEPGPKGKRKRMDKQKLVSNDPLLLIAGTRATEQSEPEEPPKEPPVEVTLVPGEWLMQFHGNREFLAEFGDVLSIASIPRGKPSGAWAACIGFALQQAWREEASTAKINEGSHGKDDEPRKETLAFGTFTRRELLTETFRSDHDVTIMVKHKTHGYKVKDYWDVAIKKLKNKGIIGYYKEGAWPDCGDWREAWLDQPLYIRPKDTRMADALEIRKLAIEARKRGRQKQSAKLAKKVQDKREDAD